MDNNEEYQQSEEIADEESFEEESPRKPYVNKPRKFQHNFRNDRYNNAYGNYSGGYGPPRGGFGYNVRPNFGDFPGPFGPPMMPPHGPPGPFFGGDQGNMWGRGFGPEGPPMLKRPFDDKTIRYLSRCGVPKEHLKNLPRDLLKLMEPEFCGLCSVALESLSVSRLHYNSKNHLKNQKKLLNQQTDFRRGKEIPLKSRELYCELCDVQITSKAHSDAHYAGKAHRAVVDGRRKPKNPMLLQQGMEIRVEQLIRREKRCLKPVETDKAEKEPSAGILPELRCDICKTSVTCSEQMTAHLNGKRHLSKEKQHILRMMRGEGDPNNGDKSQDKEENEDDEAMDDDEGGEGEEGKEESYDWGDGEGKWEDAETNQQKTADWV